MRIDSIDRLGKAADKIVNDQFKAGLFVTIMAAAMGFAFGLLIAGTQARTNAVKQSCGFYDMRTGEFRWGSPQ